MDKIINNPKLNIYGNEGMVNKHIFMRRKDNEKFTYFIYQITKVLKNKFPITYECSRLYILTIFKDHKTKASVNDKLTVLELDNNDVLNEISVEEYIAIFKVFVECEGNICRELPQPII